MAWENKFFGDCAKLIRDTVQPREALGLPYIGLEHISQGQLSLIGLGKSDDVISAKSRFRKGDILFGKLRPYFRKVVIAPFDGVCSTDIWVVRAKPGTDQKYLFYWMASNEFVETSTRASEGTKMPRAQWEFVEQIQQEVPDKTEQRAIAGILGALDDKIELNRRMNRTLESMARGVFRQWFVENEEASGWEEKSLDEIADFLNGLALQKFPASEGEEYLPVIKIAQLRTNNTEDADRASTDIPPQYVIEDGDILFSWSGSLTVVVWCGGKGALNQHLFKVTSEKYPKWFYYYWTKHHLADFQEIAAGKATTMGHIQRHHLKNAKVIVPSNKELKEMDKVMSPLIEKIIKNNLESRTLASLRDALLPKLMRGEARVKS